MLYAEERERVGEGRAGYGRIRQQTKALKDIVPEDLERRSRDYGRGR